ncbi:MAG TPA: hydroxysqualene dehydroxylase HpnE [Candidatus Binatus sp.]|uniref:hydroxysqualene dehydroxylase HpnE n=1 Tax=Candidatus Binatus sp. TaxID=2811406 RepID=UPI002B46D89D|nr:hydroxysqualene dehydroxylase HpnE [Candidatus Binatus sp.]HKN12727.1 hydroxysqualene dehydroxylase HpnE [Candidatus Binatus sp.]
MASATKDAVVIGAGFAGLSAAVALAERGVRVTVLEGKPALGGRAYSFVDADTGDFVDNGQHVLMGCYTETLDFLERIGAHGQLVFREDLEIEMLAGPGQSAVLKTARLPGPLHMTAALLGYRHLSMAERISVMCGGLRLLAMKRFGGGELRNLTVAQLMDRLGQSEHARQCFWYPMSIATLNDVPEASSAQLLAEVLKRAFFSRRRDSAFVYSRVGLSDLYCSGAKQLIERAGGTVVSHSIVEMLELGARGHVASVRLRDGRRIEASNFISAVPAPQLLRLLPENAVADPFFSRLTGLSSSPIICVHVWLDREVTNSPFIGFIGTTTQWLFNKRRIFAQRGEAHPGYLSFVISGARKLVDRSNQEILDIVINDLHAMIPASRTATVVKSLVLKEKNATMAPDLRSHQLRPTANTPIANFFLAGDWIQTELPATIESAVISGRAAAGAVIARTAE